MRRADATIRVKPPGETWQTIGTTRANGVWATGLAITANQSGPDTATFTLLRDPRRPWPDLAPFTPVEIEVGGLVVWGGRTFDSPLQDGDQRAINVTCRGWQYHLDDPLIDQGWVITDLSQWRDLTSDLNTNLSEVGTVGSVQVGQGVASLSYANGASVPANTAGDRCGFFYDAGPNRRIKRFDGSWSCGGNNGNFNVYILQSNTKPYDVGAPTLVTGLGAASSGGIAFTLTTASRYIAIMGQNGTAGAITPTAQLWFTLTAAQLYTSTAYESGGASALKASAILTDLLASLPLLSADTSRVTATSFNIPDFWPNGRQTARAITQAANAYHGYLLGVDPQARLFFAPYPTVPVCMVGQWSGAGLTDASSGAGDPLYNQVICQYTDAQNNPAEVVVSDPSAGNLVTRQGFTRSQVLPLNTAATSASATQIGQVWLTQRQAQSFKGSLTVTGSGGVRSMTGAPWHPSVLLLQPGQLIRLADRVDPSTGQMGRDATIASVSYSHDSGQATVQLDNERDRLAPLLARLAVITPASLL